MSTSQRARGARAAGYLTFAALCYLPPLFSARGEVAADTKQYLYLDPSRLMARAVSMWDPNIGLGTVTHQTIGYAFPMGPFYWVFDKLGVPDWVAQRIWLGSLLFAAGLGVLFLARTFGLRGPGVVVAALAYTFTPYVLDYAARISVLLMPWAAMPFMIAVVRRALREASARPPGKRSLLAWRYPAIFALIVQVVGGVNATALIFAGVAPVLFIVYSWLVAHEVTFRRAFAVTARIGLLTLLTSMWWISGLRMQAAYGLDILRYTETVDAVARTSTPNEVLRGLGYWFFYGQDRLGPWIESAGDYTQRLPVIAAGYLLATLSLFGAAVSRWRWRAYFIVSMVVGVVIAVGAHPYNSPTPFGSIFKSLAGSSTAALALRSTGRAAPLVVLALAMFLGLFTNVAVRWLHDRGWGTGALVVPALVVVLLAVNFPALHNGTYYGKNLQRPESIPDYWTQAIAALSAGGDNTRILEVPGADFASYSWGNTVDPITPGLTDRPYVARELIPYGTAGSADLLNAIDRRLQEGIADPYGLAVLWRRMGIGDVVARNDIQYYRYDLVPPRELARVLAQAPGVGTPTGYGPRSLFDTPGYKNEIALQAPVTDQPIAPVMVYPIQNPTPIVRAESVDHGVMMSGDGEGLVDAADTGLLDGAGAVRYAASYASAAALRAATQSGDVLVVTDNNRLRARRWTSVKDNLGYTEEPGRANKPLVHDNGDADLPVFPGETATAYTTTDEVGAQSVTASAYGNTITYTPEDRAAMAFDGDPFTSWRANAFGDARGQTLRLDLDGTITTDHVTLQQTIVGSHNRTITQAELRFDGKDTVPITLDPSSVSLDGQTFNFGRRTFHRFEIVVKQTDDRRTNLFGSADSVGFGEIKLRDEHSAHDVAIREVLQMPTDLMDALGASTVDHPLVLVMRRDAERPVPPRNQPENELDRAFTLPAARTFTLVGNGAIDPASNMPAIEQALGIADASQLGVTTDTSGFLSGCLACRPDAAIDGNPATAWQSQFVNVRGSWVSYTSFAPLSFDHLDLRVIADGRHSVPTGVALDVDGQVRLLPIPPIADQAQENATTVVHLAFPRVTGHSVKLTIGDVREQRTKIYSSKGTNLEPVGIAELGIPGLVLPKAPSHLDTGCRDDLVAIDGHALPVRMQGAAQGSEQVMALQLATCDPRDPSRTPALTLGPGRHVLTTARGKDIAWSVDRLVLASGAGDAPVATDAGRVTGIAPPAATQPQVQVTNNGRTNVHVHVTGATQPFWMVFGQSRSPGWHARVVGAKDLGAAQLVDGYANGWMVKPTSASFDMVFEWTPQKQVWASIWISLLVALACLVLIGLTWRRRDALRVLATPLPADADVAFAWETHDEIPSVHDRVRWLAPLIAGVLASITVVWWVGIVVAVLIAAAVARPDWRKFVVAIPAAIMFVVGVYMVRQQAHNHFPSVFEWPTLFPRARTPAWIAVMLLAGDAIVDMLRSRRNEPEGPAPPGES